MVLEVVFTLTLLALDPWRSINTARASYASHKPTYIENKVMLSKHLHSINRCAFQFMATLVICCTFPKFNSIDLFCNILLFLGFHSCIFGQPLKHVYLLYKKSLCSLISQFVCPFSHTIKIDVFSCHRQIC